MCSNPSLTCTPFDKTAGSELFGSGAVKWFMWMVMTANPRVLRESQEKPCRFKIGSMSSDSFLFCLAYLVSIGWMAGNKDGLTIWYRPDMLDMVTSAGAAVMLGW